MDKLEVVIKAFHEITGRKSRYYLERLIEVVRGLTDEEANDEVVVKKKVVACIEKMQRTKSKLFKGKKEFTGLPRKANKIYLRPEDATELKIVSEDYLISHKDMYEDFQMGKDHGVSIVRDGKKLLFNEEYWGGIDLEEYTKLVGRFTEGRVATPAEIGIRALRGALRGAVRGGDFKDVFGEGVKQELRQAEPFDSKGVYLRSEGKGVYEIDMTAAYLQIFTYDRLPKNNPIGGEPVKGFCDPTEGVIYRYEMTGGRSCWYNNGWTGDVPLPASVLRTIRFMPVNKAHKEVIKDFGEELLEKRKQPGKKQIYKFIANSLIGKLSWDAPVAVQYIYDKCRYCTEVAMEYIKSLGFSVQACHTDSVRFYGNGDWSKFNLADLPYQWRLENNDSMDCISYNCQVQQFRDAEGKVSWKHSGIRGECPAWGEMPSAFNWSRLKVSNKLSVDDYGKAILFDIVPNSHSVKEAA